MAKLNRRQRIAYFRREILPVVREHYEQDRRIDVPARREAWNNMIDAMAREGDITTRQAFEDKGLPAQFEPRPRKARRRSTVTERVHNP